MTVTAQDASEALSLALGEVLETVVFRCLEAAEAEVEAPPELIEARVTFQGDRAGALRLWFDATDASGLARAFLGLEDAEPLEPAEVHDALGELANMVVGGALLRHCPDASIALDHPAVQGADPASREAALAAPLRALADVALVFGDLQVGPP